MGSIVVDGVIVTFVHRDAALVNDDEFADIKAIVALERDSLRHRAEDETLEQIEFISDDVNPLQSRYNTVSEVTSSLEEVDED